LQAQPIVFVFENELGFAVTPTPQLANLLTVAVGNAELVQFPLLGGKIESQTDL
jgi:hypothetical protein